MTDWPSHETKALFQVITSNNLNILADDLHRRLVADGRAPFERHTVAVPGPEMEQWLALALARRMGISAQIDYVLPARLIWNLLQQVWPSAHSQSPFDRGRLTMRLLELFISRRDELPPEVLRYVVDRDESALLAFAQRLATQFDRYLVYRPEWIVQWEAGEIPHWQASVWRQLSLSDQPAHWARVTTSKRILDGLSKHVVSNGPIYFFAPTPLSPGYLRVLKAVSGAVPVILLIHNPCAAYWADIADRKAISRVAVTQPDALPYYDQGNRLLASLGGFLKGFLGQLQELVDLDDELFESPASPSVLHRLQADMLQLQQPGGDAHKQTILDEPAGGSLQIHCCHSRLREVEVLQDQILSLLDADPALGEHEIGVYVPDLETYGPLVRAVFGSAPERRRLNFSLTHSGIGTATLFEQFLDLLDGLLGRFAADDIAGLLDIPALRRRFDLEVSDVDALRRWISVSGARWGLDDNHLAGFDAVGHHNTWEWARMRLLSAYGLAASRSESFADTAVPQELEGTEAQAVGNLLALIEVLSQLRESSGRARSPQRWTAWIRYAAGVLLTPDELEQWTLQRLYDTLATVQEDADIAGLDSAVSWQLFSAVVRRHAKTSSGNGMLSRGVSFVSARPGSVLPFKVICMLGLNDGEFPALEEQWDIDLTRGQVRSGDRSARAEAGLIFLELLTRAQSVVRFTYVGRDQRTDDPLPPAPCLTELIEYLSQDAGLPLDRFHFEHPLQPFSGRYDNETFFTYEDFPEVAQDEQVFIDSPLPVAAQTPLQLNDLLAFYQNPAKFLLTRSLGMALTASRLELQGMEPFEVTSLDRWSLRTDLLALGLEGRSRETLEQHFLLSPVVPSGSLGQGLAQGLIEESASLAERSRQWTTPPGEAIAVNLSIGDGLQGVLEGYGTEGRIQLRPGRLKSSHLLTKWIEHLVFNLVAPAGFEKMTGWMTVEAFSPMWRWGPVARSADYLTDLMNLFVDHQSVALAFAPDTCFELYRAQFEEQPDPIAKARQKWRSRRALPWEEGADPYLRLLLGADPLKDEHLRQGLVDSANRLFAPMFEHRVDPD